jgi:hypothetical protein
MISDDQRYPYRVQTCTLLGVLTIEETSPLVPISAQRIMESNYFPSICNMLSSRLVRSSKSLIRLCIRPQSTAQVQDAINNRVLNFRCALCPGPTPIQTPNWTSDGIAVAPCPKEKKSAHLLNLVMRAPVKTTEQSAVLFD